MKYLLLFTSLFIVSNDFGMIRNNFRYKDNCEMFKQIHMHSIQNQIIQEESYLNKLNKKKNQILYQSEENQKKLNLLNNLYEQGNQQDNFILRNIEYNQSINLKNQQKSIALDQKIQFQSDLISLLKNDLEKLQASFLD